MPPATERQAAYGQEGLSPVDRFGVWLSLRAVRRALPAGAALLDLGCGHDARLVRQLAGRWSRATVVDVALAPELRAMPGVEAIEATIEEALPALPAESFDAVLLVNVLEHLSRAGEALAACHELLAPGGALLVNVPTWLGKRALELAAFRLGVAPALEMDDHKAYYGIRDLWPLLVAAGFRPSAIRMRHHKAGLNLFAVARRA